jgi:uncharacterized protein (UPF0332 family)
MYSSSRRAVQIGDLFEKRVMNIIEKHLGLNDDRRRYIARMFEFYSNLGPGSQEEWHDRYLRAGRSLLTSCALNLQSEDLLVGDQSIILSTVGRYYSIFHGCFALLCQHPVIPYKNLERMHHRELEREMIANFVKPGMLNSDFAEGFTMAKKAREAINYRPERLSKALGGRKSSEFVEETDGVLGQLYATNLVLSRIFLKAGNQFVPSLQTIIGDGIGEDWVSEFCSREDRDRIWKVLTEFELST